MVPLLAMMLLLIGGMCILDGLLGRMVNSHPHCGECGYDLVDSVGHVESCPECGRAIQESDLRWGRFDKRWQIAMLGGTMALGGIGLLVWSLVR
jgi:hypothetical protein